MRDNLFAGQTPHDRPDLVTSVFDIKKTTILKYLKSHRILGHTLSHIQVIYVLKKIITAHASTTSFGR